MRELLTLYERSGSQPEVEIAPTKAIRLRDERQISLWVVAAFALVVVGAGLSYWRWGQQPATDSMPTAADIGRVDIGRDAAAPPPAATRADAVEPVPAAVATEPEPQPLTEAESEAESVAESDAESELATAFAVESPDPVEDALSQVAPPTADTPAERPIAGAVETLASGDGPVLEVIFVEDCWTEITDEDGSRLYYNLGRAGTRARLPADRNLKIYFGNASGVELRIDGETVPVPGAGRRRVVSFDLDDVIE